MHKNLHFIYFSMFVCVVHASEYKTRAEKAKVCPIYKSLKYQGLRPNRNITMGKNIALPAKGKTDISYKINMSGLWSNLWTNE